VSADAGGRVDLGNFVRRDGTRWRRLALESDLAGMELELERSRLPKYLEVRFPPKPEESKSGHRTWRLEVRVPPNAARGPFPRREDPAYRDSAVYVRIAGKTPRSIRIPVTGVANDS
jgi:hypothetical protein